MRPRCPSPRRDLEYSYCGQNLSRSSVNPSRLCLSRATQKNYSCDARNGCSQRGERVSRRTSRRCGFVYLTLSPSPPTLPPALCDNSPGPGPHLFLERTVSVSARCFGIKTESDESHAVQVCGAWSSLAPNGIWSGSCSAAIMHADGPARKGGVQDGPDNADPARRVLDKGGLGQLSMTWAPSTCVRSGIAFAGCIRSR